MLASCILENHTTLCLRCCNYHSIVGIFKINQTVMYVPIFKCCRVSSGSYSASLGTISNTAMQCYTCNYGGQSLDLDVHHLKSTTNIYVSITFFSLHCAFCFGTVTTVARCHGPEGDSHMESTSHFLIQVKHGFIYSRTCNC